MVFDTYLSPSALARLREYSDDEPRDDHGRWSGGGGGSSKDDQPESPPLINEIPGMPGFRAADFKYGRTNVSPLSTGPPADAGAPAGTDSRGAAMKVGDAVTTNSTGIQGEITKAPDSLFGRLTIDSGYGAHAVDGPAFAHVLQARPSEVTRLGEALALLDLLRGLA